MNRLHQLLVLIVLCWMGAATAQDSQRPTVLLLDRIDKTAHVPVPRRGHSMDRVLSEYGEPQSRHPAVGDPPITRWVYREFTVVFEGNRVIRAVVNRATPEETLG